MARSLDGTSSDKIDCGTSSVLNPTTAMSFSCWINSPFSNAYNVLFSRYLDGSHYVVLQPKSSGKIAFYYVAFSGLTSSYDGGGTYTIGANTWAQVGFSIPPTAGYASGYVNGLWDFDTNTLTTGGVAETSGANTYIGYNAGAGANGIDGLIAEAAVWNVDLTAGEMAILGKGFSPLFVRPNSLVAYWPLIGRTSPEIDVVGGFNGTLTGTGTAPHPRVIMPSRPLIGHATAAAAPSGRIFKLAGYGGGLVGAPRGLVAKPKRKRVIMPPPIERPVHVSR